MSQKLSLTAGNPPAEAQARRGLPVWLPGGMLILLGALGLSAALLARQWSPSRPGYEVVYGQPMWAMHASMHGQEGGMPGSWMAADTGPLPAAEMVERFYDFGALSGAEEASHSFVLANRGDAPLLITDAYTTCFCARAEIGAGVIPPGKAALITVYINPALAGGGGAAIRRGIILETNDPLQPLIELWVQANLSKTKSDR